MRGLIDLVFKRMINCILNNTSAQSIISVAVGDVRNSSQGCDFFSNHFKNEGDALMAVFLDLVPFQTIALRL